MNNGKQKNAANSSISKPHLGDVCYLHMCYFKLIISNQKFTIFLEDHPAVVYYKSMGKLLQNRANIYVIIVNNNLKIF